MRDFRKELEQLINIHSKENGSNTPDYILAEYLHVCLLAFDTATNEREKWYGRQSHLKKSEDIVLSDPMMDKVPSVPQEGHRWCNADGSESAATGRQSQDVNDTDS